MDDWNETLLSPVSCEMPRMPRRSDAVGWNDTPTGSVVRCHGLQSAAQRISFDVYPGRSLEICGGVMRYLQKNYMGSPIWVAGYPIFAWSINVYHHFPYDTGHFRVEWCAPQDTIWPYAIWSVGGSTSQHVEIGWSISSKCCTALVMWDFNIWMWIKLGMFFFPWSWGIFCDKRKLFRGDDRGFPEP